MANNKQLAKEKIKKDDEFYTEYSDIQKERNITNAWFLFGWRRQEYCFDIIIDFKVKNREEVYKEIYDEVQNKYKGYKIDINLDIDVSD